MQMFLLARPTAAAGSVEISELQRAGLVALENGALKVFINIHFKYFVSSKEDTFDIMLLKTTYGLLSTGKGYTTKLRLWG
jgi:hypothetical protein